MVEVKSKQLLILSFRSWESVIGKLNKSFSQGMIVGTNTDYLYRMLRIWVRVLEEAHGYGYSILPGATKMYHDLREDYSWDGWKRDIAEFISNSPNFKQVKLEHIKLSGLTQIMDVPTWKWEDINMDFIVGLPQARR